MISPEGWKIFVQKLELDFSYSFDGYRFRVNIFHDARGYNIAIRYIPNDLPTLEAIGITDTIKNLLAKQKGLILVTGPTGSGKSTTLAALINYLNENYKRHIITIEDPIEFNFQNKQCLVNQREL
jgi:twitching motility protein PilT